MADFWTHLLPGAVRDAGRRAVVWLRQRPRSLKRHMDYWRGFHVEPREYYAVFDARSRYVADLVARHAEADAAVLEVGCNVGMNLRALHEAGFRRLVGLDVSEAALDAFRRYWPESAAPPTRLFAGPMEQWLPTFADREFGAVLAVRTLAHVHARSTWVFRELARVTGGVLITVEVETSADWKHFPRDYRAIFEGLGLRQVEAPAFDDAMPKMGKGTVVRVFKPQ